MNATSAIAVVADREVISELRALIAAEGLAVSEPLNTESPADALDAAISPDDIQAIFQTITVIAGTGTASLTFLDKLLDVVRRRRGAAELRDAKSGRALGRVDAETTAESASAMLGK